jgi:hypothetical protein
VTFRRDDGRVQKYRIVGEDEADPTAGSISFVSQVARLLMGQAAGDVVGTSGQEAWDHCDLVVPPYQMQSRAGPEHQALIRLIGLATLGDA